ncbi:MAG: DUF4446 family protein [Armatimonadetes bacterium]|nr:DUF4446 family protein [Armatimonadota bacterium]
MDVLLDNLNHSPGAALLGTIAVLLALVVTVTMLALRAKSQRDKWARLMQGSDGGNVESLLERHLAEREELVDKLRDSHERIELLEKKIRSAKRYVGLVNYDAFDDVGGNQSFAVAIYDEEGNGAVLTSQVGREGCRVYGKSLTNGKPDRHLSTEEELAIEQATALRGRPRISP